MSARGDLFERAVVDEADRVVRQAIDTFLAAAGKQRAVVVTAPAGAGKSSLVCRAVAAARRQRLRVAVASPTNDQAFGLVERLAVEHPQLGVSFFPASKVLLPEETTRRRNVRVVDAEGACKADAVVATVAKLGDAFSRGKLQPFDAILVDESYQADAAGYYAIGHLAPTHLLVGDGGQISPFSAISDADQWRGLDEDPLQTAVGVLLRNHRNTPVFKLPVTRRLDPRAVPVARAFYPAIRFGAAVRPGVRQLDLAGAGKRRPVDRALDLAAERGWAHVELPEATTLSADPEMIQMLVDLAVRLRERSARVRCERQRSWTPPRVAVGVSHNDQKDQLRTALAAAGCEDVDVDTANKLQGLEYDVVLAWHPLCGLSEPDEFHLDAGRLCVLLTRHRHACILVGRAGDRALVDGVPPTSPSYIGSDDEPLLDGWAAHEEAFAALEPFRLSL